ncbi:MAG TPA: ATP-dependent DNA helicase RecG [Kineosporiaceae bacterium]|nr:ATP-dependent DNA helicase RecG [Kineosporiaceae bacterium]
MPAGTGTTQACGKGDGDGPRAASPAPAAGTHRLDEPLDKVLGVRSKGAGLTQLGLHTVGDLLRHYPRRYQRWGELTPLRQLPEGEEVTILAEVVRATARQMKTRRGELLQCVVSDGTDTLDLTFFNARNLKRMLVPGRVGLFSGVVGRYQGRPQLTHPKLHLLNAEEDAEAAVAAIEGPIPVYPATAKLDSEAIRRSVGLVLDTLGDVPDPIPPEVRARHGLVSLREAFGKVHRPADEDDHRTARYRLRFEEAFVLQAALARRRLADGALPATPRTPGPGGLLAEFDRRLPFTLTAGQREVGEQIAADLAREHPMHRLLQGEVGSGKTVVALRAMLAVVDAGGQAALLAPTEVLAVQHHRSITAMLGDLAAGGLLGGDERGTRVALVTGSMSAAARRAALLDVASGDAGIVVGTHALLQEKVEFFDLGLVVVDEQHRFGVEQRDALRGKGRTTPHLLVMTATPIPRTVAMTVFGDLETSTLAELPAGRSPIGTHLVPVGEKPAWYERTWQRLREEVDAGHQAYVVCPRIGDDEDPGGRADATTDGDGSGGYSDEDGAARRPARAVLEVVEEIRAHPALSGLVVETLHGRMPADARESVMRRFAAGQVDVLVATTVIEVGVDVPNATAMVVLDADRFGVSQLHQLRGRVGRGAAGGLCLLVSEAAAGTPARDRLEAVARTLDGFELARVDLEARREGDVLGSAQSGVRSSLRLLRVLRDEKLIETARHEATAVVAADPELSGHPVLAAAIRDLLDPEREAYLERG